MRCRQRSAPSRYVAPAPHTVRGDLGADARRRVECLAADRLAQTVHATVRRAQRGAARASDLRRGDGPSGWSHGCCGRRSRRCGERLDCNPPRDNVVRVAEGCAVQSLGELMDGRWRCSPGTRGQVRRRLVDCCEKPATNRAGATVAQGTVVHRANGQEVARCVETGWWSVVVRATRKGVRCATISLAPKRIRIASPRGRRQREPPPSLGSATTSTS